MLPIPKPSEGPAPPQRRSSLERLRRLAGVTWRWSSSAPRSARRTPAVGVIAQDVEAEFPELVTTGRDGYKRVNYTGLIGPLVEAVRELDERLSRLEAASGQPAPPAAGEQPPS